MLFRNTHKSISWLGILLPLFLTLINIAVFIWALGLVSISAPGGFRWSEAETIVSIVHFGSALMLSSGLLLLLRRSYAIKSRLFYVMPVVFFGVAQLAGYLALLTPRIRTGSPYVSLSFEALLWQPPICALVAAAVGFLIALLKYHFTSKRA